jgi:hypothetical protein
VTPSSEASCSRVRYGARITEEVSAPAVPCAVTVDVSARSATAGSAARLGGGSGIEWGSEETASSLIVVSPSGRKQLHQFAHSNVGLREW